MWMVLWQCGTPAELSAATSLLDKNHIALKDSTGYSEGTSSMAEKNKALLYDAKGLGRGGEGSQCRGGSSSYPTSGSHRSVAERVIVMSKCLFMFDLSSRSFYPLWWWVQLRIPGLLFWWHISLLLWAVELQCCRCSTCHMYVFPPDISCTSLINDVLQELVPVFTASSFYFFLKSLLSLAPVK